MLFCFVFRWFPEKPRFLMFFDGFSPIFGKNTPKFEEMLPVAIYSYLLSRGTRNFFEFFYLNFTLFCRNGKFEFRNLKKQQANRERIPVFPQLGKVLGVKQTVFSYCVEFPRKRDFSRCCSVFLSFIAWIDVDLMQSIPKHCRIC